MELIDRNEVGAKIQAMYIRREMDYGGENEFCRGMRKALRIIEDAPTIEASPCDFCQYDGCGNPCIVCPATARGGGDE